MPHRKIKNKHRVNKSTTPHSVSTKHRSDYVYIYRVFRLFASPSRKTVLKVYRISYRLICGPWFGRTCAFPSNGISLLKSVCWRRDHLNYSSLSHHTHRCLQALVTHWLRGSGFNRKHKEVFTVAHTMCIQVTSVDRCLACNCHESDDHRSSGRRWRSRDSVVAVNRSFSFSVDFALRAIVFVRVFFSVK